MKDGSHGAGTHLRLGWRYCASGALSGLTGTVAMSTVLAAADAAGAMDRQPPRKIIQKFLPVLPPRIKDAAAVSAHFAYGTASGAVYAMLAGSGRPNAVTGTVYGALVWLAGYEGWLPAFGVQPPAHRDKPGRAWTMLAAHLVYGMVLGWTERRVLPAPALSGRR